VELVGFVAAGAKLKPGDALPKEIVVVPWGELTSRNRGSVICNEETLAGFEAFQRSKRHDHVMGDFNHNTIPGNTEKEPKAKAAKFAARVERGVGVICAAQYWTPEGEQYVGGGHYPDISPAVYRNERGVVLGLHSVGFCEHGELADGHLELFSAATAALQNQTNNKTKSMDYKKMLCDTLGLPADATDEQIAAAVAGKAAPAEGMSAAGAQSVRMRAAEVRPDIEFTAFAAEIRKTVADLGKQITGVVQQAEGARIDGMIAGAVGERKEIKLDRDTLVAMGAENAGKYLASLTPGVVPVSGAAQGNSNAKEAGKNSDGGQDPDAFSAAQEAQMRANGVDPAKVKANLTAL
jgi:phage I-like protein